MSNRSSGETWGRASITSRVAGVSARWTAAGSRRRSTQNALTSKQKASWPCLPAAPTRAPAGAAAGAVRRGEGGVTTANLMCVPRHSAPHDGIAASRKRPPNRGFSNNLWHMGQKYYGLPHPAASSGIKSKIRVAQIVDQDRITRRPVALQVLEESERRGATPTSRGTESSRGLTASSPRSSQRGPRRPEARR